MFILDTDNFRVQRFLAGQSSGVTIAGGRGTGTTLDKIGTSYALFVDTRLNIYVSEFANSRIAMWLNGNTTTGVLVSILHALLLFVYVVSLPPRSLVEMVPGNAGGNQCIAPAP